MQNNNSTTQLMDVAMRIREMREILGKAEIEYDERYILKGVTIML